MSKGCCDGVLLYFFYLGLSKIRRVFFIESASMAVYWSVPQEQEAQLLLKALKQRYQACKLALHPDKTRIVYCKDANRQACYPRTLFTFLGYDFHPRKVINREGQLFMSFAPAVSKAALKEMRAKTRRKNFGNRTGMSLEEIANEYNPVLRGWINYYGRYNPSRVRSRSESF